MEPKKIDAPAAATMPVAAILIEWLWNGYIPDPVMTTEVAVAAGVVVGAVVRWAIKRFVSE